MQISIVQLGKRHNQHRRGSEDADSATMHNLITAQPLKYMHTSRNTPADTQCRRRCQTKPANIRPDDLHEMPAVEPRIFTPPGKAAEPRTRTKTTREFRPILGWSLSAPQPCLDKQAARSDLHTVAPYVLGTCCACHAGVNHASRSEFPPRLLWSLFDPSSLPRPARGARDVSVAVAQHVLGTSCACHAGVKHAIKKTISSQTGMVTFRPLNLTPDHRICIPPRTAASLSPVFSHPAQDAASHS